jgi:hypothetical protein
MKNHSVSDNNCNTVNLPPPPKKYKVTKNVGLASSVGDNMIYNGLQVVLNNTIGIGDTKYHV